MCGTPTIPAAARFFSIPRRSGMYVSQWKKQSKGNHMKQNYTPDLVLNKWQNIQENLCNELPFYSFKKWTKGFQKKNTRITSGLLLPHLFCMVLPWETATSPKIWVTWLAASKKNRDGGFLWVDIPGTNETSTHSKWQIGWWFLFFLPWKDGWKSSNLHPFTNGWPNGFPGISSSCSGLESQSSMVSFPEQNPT